MKLSIRNARLGDFEIIGELAEELGYKSSNSLVKNRLHEIIKNVDNCVFIALDNEKVIGWIHGVYTLRIQSDAFVEIGGLVVSKDYWKKGVGKKLVECVFKWTESKNCKNIRVRCNVLRSETHKFYEKIGFKLNKEQKVFDKQVDMN